MNAIKINLCFLFSAAFLLLAPAVTHAGIIPGPFDIVEGILSSVEEITAPLMKVVVDICITYFAALISLAMATNILQWVISNPDWINLHGTVVTEGWKLSKGMANLFLLFIFLVVAFGFILRIEGVQARKSLPRLIIVALLINFSSLFVGMIVDVSTVLYSTIIQGHEGLVGDVMRGFLNGMYSMLAQIVLWITETIVTLAIPLAGGLKQVAIALSLVTKGFFVLNAPVWIMQILVAFELTGIFMLYIFFFAARVYIIQILAILSPLAFLCLILPQTQKYWSEWLKHLLQWTFVGAFLIFFLVLGFSAADFLLPSGDPLAINSAEDYLGAILPTINIPKYFQYYSFLFIYLAITVWLVDRTMPLIAVAITGFATGFATKAWTSYGQPAAGKAKEEMNRLTAETQARQKDIKEGNIQLKGTDMLAHQLSVVATSPIAGWHRLNQTTPAMAVSKGINREMETFEKKFGKDTDAVDNSLKTLNMKFMSAGQKMAYMQFGSKYKGGDFYKEMDEKGHLDESLRLAMVHKTGLVKEAVGYVPQKLEGSLAPQLKKTILSSTSGKREIERMEDVHGLDKPREEIETKAAYSLAAKSILGDKDKVKNWNREALGNEELQEAIIDNATSSDIQRLGETHGQTTVDAIHEKFKVMGPERVAKTNAKLERATVSNPGVREVFAPHEEVEINPESGESRPKNEQLREVDKHFKTAKEEIGRERERRAQRDAGQAAGGAGFGGGGAAGPGGRQQPGGGAGTGGATPPPPGLGRPPGGGGGAAGPGGGQWQRGTSRSGRTSGVYEDDTTQAGFTAPPGGPRRTPGGGGTAPTSQDQEMGPEPRRSRSGRTSNIYDDDTTAPP